MGFVGSAIGGIAKGIGGIFGGIGGGIAEGSGATNSFHGYTPPIQTENYVDQINGTLQRPNFVDYSQSNQTAGQQQALAQALLSQSQGNGPNPAQQALQQATNRNIQQNAGLIASQKGINPALQARLIAQNAASANQQAAGQGALMQAQQQLGAQGQLAQALGAERQQDITQATQNKELQSQYIGMLQNAQAAQNSAINQAYLGAQGINANVAGQNAQIRGQITGGLLNAGGALGAAALSHGGYVPGQAEHDGDHESNDTVPAMLSPGEIVIPRSHAKDSDKAKEFIDHLKGGKSGKGKHYGEILKLKKRIKELEASK